jgi:hypothetical protein
MKISFNMSCSIHLSFCSLTKDRDLAILKNVAILRIVHFKSKDGVQIKSHKQSDANVWKMKESYKES